MWPRNEDEPSYFENKYPIVFSKQISPQFTFSFLLENKMSAEEDTELRDLVAQCLETNGVLNKIRVGEFLLYSECVCS